MGAIDEAILEIDALISKLFLIHQGLVHDLTTLGVNEEGKIRHASQAKDSRETQLGTLPVSWGVDSIGRMANDLALGTAARGANDGKDQLHLLKMGNFGWDTLDTSTCELIDVERVVGWRDALLVDGDLLFNTRNTPELVGKTDTYDQNDYGTVSDNNILRIRLPDEKMDGRFAAAYMANGLGKSRLLALATGTTSVAAIYWRDLRDFKLPVPPREEREEIVRRLQASRDRIRREREYRAKLFDLRAGIRDDLLNGRGTVLAIREAVE
jgi:type I restriction enzyme, S subunit